MVHRGTLGRDDAGTSLLELMVYLAVLAVIAVPLGTMTVSVSRSSAEGDLLSRILERNRSAVSRLVSEYRKSIRGTTTVTNGGKTLGFTTSAGFNGAGPITGPSIRYEIRLDPGEAQNGIDDNKNGLVDESVLVRVDPARREEVVLAAGLVTSRSSFAPAGGGVRITLTTGGRAGGAVSICESQRSLTVFPRN